MKYKNLPFLFMTAGAVIVVAIGIFLATATPVSAQCGSQASSCKNCHEVQGQDPVNSDGTGWHQSHAFGDFCYICHAGNQQATDKDAAHQGMVDPLSDVQASCQQCHVSDYQERAQVYATALGVTLGSGSVTPASGTSDAASTSADATPATAVPSSGQDCNEVVVDDPDAVNYTQSYDEAVLGKKPINWGNSILTVLIGLMVVGGGGFVITREKLIDVEFEDMTKVGEGYPADVVEMLPKLAGLKAETRKSLKKVLDDPEKAANVLDQVVGTANSEKTEEE